MKKITILLIAVQLVSLNSFAGRNDARHLMKKACEFSDSNSAAASSSELTGCVLGFSTYSIPATTSDIAGDHSSKMVMGQAVAGASQIDQTQEGQDVSQIINADANLRAALAVLLQEGFEGTIGEAAKKILDRATTLAQ